MAFLATSSFIYTAMFGCSSEVYSYFFAANAFTSMAGPPGLHQVFRDMPRKAFLSLCFTVTAVCGLLLTLFGGLGPFTFAALFMPLNFFGSASRTVGTALMMSQLDSDNGTVASLMGSTSLFFGSMAMLLSSLAWPTPVAAVGAISLGSGALCLGLWLYANHRQTYRDIGK